jgi:putative ABC transport system substrate-binding protein
MAIHIRRRDFIVTLGSAAAAFPVAARAQAPDIPVVGFLHAGHERPRAVASFQKGLAEGGYVADRNVAFDFRWADEEFDPLPGLAADLVRRNVAVIAAFGNAAARAAKAATATIPIAFASSSDPAAVTPNTKRTQRLRGVAKIAKPTIEIRDKVRLNLEKFV